MGYPVSLHFDEESNKKIINIIKGICKNGVNSFMLDINTSPHIAIASYREIDTEEFFSRLELFTNKIQKFSITFESVGIFFFGKNIICLSPVMTDELMRLHKDFHNEFNLNCCRKPFEHYLPNKWVPNCRVVVNATLEETVSAVTTLSATFKPFDVKVAGMNVVDVNTLKYIAKYNFEN